MRNSIRNEDRLPGDRFRLNLHARPADITRDSPENQAWNLRTLSLMSRAGLIKLEAEPPPRRNSEESEEDWAARQKLAFEQYFASLVVRLLRGDLTDPDVWSSLVQEVRRRTRQADEKNLLLMEEVLGGGRDIAEVFEEAYTIRGVEGLASEIASVFPQRSCGGCTNCRRVSRQPYSGFAGTPPPVRDPAISITPQLLSAVGAGRNGIEQNGILTVFYDPPVRDLRAWLRQCDQVLKTCVRHGIRNLVVPASVISRPSIQEAHTTTGDHYVFVTESASYPSLVLPRLPTLVVFTPALREAVIPAPYYWPSLPLRVLFVPSDARDPDRPDVLLAKMRYPNTTLESFLGML
jgi:hypothetical protein